MTSVENKKMISISKNFQSSVNIAYDLHDKKKIKGFIPTSESLEVIEEIFESVFSASANRAHVLIGAYGKGKSHIVLEALNLLYEKDGKLFEGLLEKIREQNSGLYEDIVNYLSSKRKILPIIISGSSTSLSQSFLLSLYQTLKQNGLERFMPDSNFTAVLNTIKKWKEEYPSAYKEFRNELSAPPKEFIMRLQSFDSKAYEEFESIYPKITNGSEFNPFSNSDIVELYVDVSKKLCDSGEGWDGIFVVYDEFSKYLESSISKASINDIKLLQDFAEKCSRTNSGKNKNQLHLLLISHKEFSNYIDNLPKEKVDGWKGVSERFKQIVLTSDYSQVYEVIGEVIKKDKKTWNDFKKLHGEEFENIIERKSVGKLFYYKKEDCKKVTENCYPLSPVTSYILPRLSEKIAQNERTLFTFLAGNEKNTLCSLLEKKSFDQSKMQNVEPDILFDYFEGQLRSESYTSPIKKTYSKSKKCLEFLKGENSPSKNLEEKLIKTLCLIYCLEQFERLSPTVETLIDIYSNKKNDWKLISSAIDNLLKNNLLYLSRSNNFLVIKENSQFDLQEMILNTIEKRKHKVSEIEILNSINHEKFLYPVKYNIKNQMTRYFDFVFFSVNEIRNYGLFEDLEKDKVDGLVLGLIDDDENSSYKKNLNFVKILSARLEFSCVVLRKENDFLSVSKQLRELDAVEFLLAFNAEDEMLCDELKIIKEDLSESIQNYIEDFTHPENERSAYFSFGEEKKLYRKSQLEDLLTEICELNFKKTPVINNETLNKNLLSGAADKSRRILVDAILNSEQADLGIAGGQELSFMRSTLCVPGILNTRNDYKIFYTSGDLLVKKFTFLFEKIDGFCNKAEKKELGVSLLIDVLSNKKNGIGLRRGIIPVYLAVAFSRFKRNVVIKNALGELALNADTLCSLTENPDDYRLEIVSFDKPKEIYVNALCKMFNERVLGEELNAEKITYSQIVNMMLTWYRALPKYSRENKKNVCAEFIRFMNELKNALSNSQRFLFVKIPEFFGTDDFGNKLIQKIQNLKSDYEGLLSGLEEELIAFTKKIFVEKTCGIKGNALQVKEGESLCSLYKKIISLLEKENPEIMNHKFENGAEALFVVFENCGNDEHKIINTMAPVLTGINTVDWNDSTIDTFERRLKEFVDTLFDYAKCARDCRGGVAVAERSGAMERNRNPEKPGDMSESEWQAPRKINSHEYRILFADEKSPVHFEKIECSKKAESLEKEMLNILDEYAQSVSKSEKREVLMSVLKELCK